MKTDTEILDFIQANKVRLSAIYSDRWVAYTGLVEEYGKSPREAVERAMDRTETIMKGRKL